MRRLLMITLTALPLLAFSPSGRAACSFSPSTGDDAFTCDSDTAPSLSDTDGNNNLVFPAGGTGAITGNVAFGGGSDNLEMASGSIGGTVNQGGGIDTFTMSAGTIGGSLNQGDGLDRFLMTGGWITGTFDSGDYAEMDDGRIGNVNMRLDENTFIMRGGSIDRNLITAFDRDYVEIFDGTIGGNISVSGGDDQVLVHGGSIGGDVLLSVGNDRFSWDGGSIGGQVDLAGGDDSALLDGLGAELLNVRVDGGLGNDSLVFANSQPSDGSLYPQWERIGLTNGSQLTLDNALVLGDAESGTGVLDIDASSRLVSRSGSVVPFAAGQTASVINAGTIDLSSGNDAQGRLLVLGNYTGAGGTLKVNSVLAGDNAASDRLVVSQGSIGGETLLQVNNLGGAGAVTSQNGIQVVEAREGTTSSADAFVQTQVLSAGAYDYRLFKGGVTAGSENSWYLRSTLVAPVITEVPPVEEPTPAPEPGQPIEPEPEPGQPAEPVQPATVAPVAAAAPGQLALPAAVAGQSVPLYRPEVPVYAAAPRGAAVIARLALGTFHQRQGDQRLLTGEGALGASWGQFTASEVRQDWSGTVSPSLNGDVTGFKVGQDMYAWTNGAGYRQQVGIYVAHQRLDADVKGFALGQKDRRVGDLKLEGDSAGVYWTLVTDEASYLDAVLQYTDLDGHARSDRGDRLDLDGHAWTASLEAGHPFTLNQHWTLEPQAQVIAQKVSLDSAQDSVSTVSYDAQTELTGRVGLRLEGAFGTTGRLLQPYVQADIWHGDGGRDTLTFDAVDQIKTDYRFTALAVETGLVARLNPSLSLHGGVQHTSNLDSRQQSSTGVNLGLRLDY